MNQPLSPFITDEVNRLYNTLHDLIIQGQRQAVQTLDTVRTLTYWHLGKQLKVFLTGEEKAPYGSQIMALISQQLMRAHGKGYSRANLFHFLRFYEFYPDEKLVYSLSRQLSWTHFRSLIYLEDVQERAFYQELCQHENWPTRSLREKIASRLYQRTALSKQPEALIEKELKALRQGQPISPALILRDPYMLNFLELPAEFSEADLEQAILNELTHFLQELGSDFCFVARQKRISAGKKDHYLDLLMYHRTLRRLIAIELKLGAFQPAYKGQMELYLNWLNKHERRVGEEAPLGIILCAEKDQEEIELLELTGSNIHVAEYLVALPSKDWLEDKLRQAIVLAKERLTYQQLTQEEEEEGHV